jgi:hypothetical protein
MLAFDDARASELLACGHVPRIANESMRGCTLPRRLLRIRVVRVIRGLPCIILLYVGALFALLNGFSGKLPIGNQIHLSHARCQRGHAAEVAPKDCIDYRLRGLKCPLAYAIVIPAHPTSRISVSLPVGVVFEPCSSHPGHIATPPAVVHKMHTQIPGF